MNIYIYNIIIYICIDMHIMIYTHTCTVSGSSRAYLEATGEYSEMYIHTIYMYDSYVYI